MNEFPGGLLLYLLIFLGVALFNYVIRRIEASRQTQGQLPRPAKPTARTPRAAQGTHRVRGAAANGPPESDIVVRRVVAPAAAPMHTARDARALVTGRRNLRRAVIAMAVLGPCRAQEPQEYQRCRSQVLTDSAGGSR
jgi:hypothetical protein